MASSDTALNAPLAVALSAISAVLRELPGKGMVIGGIAVIAHDVPRTTRDIDATVRADDLEDLVARCRRHGIVPRIDDAVPFAPRCSRNPSGWAPSSE